MSFCCSKLKKNDAQTHSVSNDLTHHFCCFSIRHPELRTAAAAIWGAPALPRFCWMVRLIRILSGSSRGRPHGSPPAMRWDLEGWRSMKNPSILMWTTGVKGFDSQPSFLFLGISLCQHWVFAVVFFFLLRAFGSWPHIWNCRPMVIQHSYGESPCYPGWWLTYTSEKWWSESQLGWLFHFQLFLESHKIPWFQSAPSSHILSILNRSLIRRIIQKLTIFHCQPVTRDISEIPGQVHQGIFKQHQVHGLLFRENGLIWRFFLGFPMGKWTFWSSDLQMGTLGNQVFFDEIKGFHGISCEHIMNMVDFNETLDLYETVRKP